MIAALCGKSSAKHKELVFRALNASEMNLIHLPFTLEDKSSV